MPTIPPNFERIPWSSFERTAGSPDLADDFRGIAIAGPSKVIFSDRPTLPVCGSYQVSARFFNRFRSFINEIVIVAVSASTHRPRATNLLRRDFEPVRTGFDPSRPGFDEIVVSGHFNLDLFRWIEDLPPTPDRYIVYATAADITSNAITVELVSA